MEAPHSNYSVLGKIISKRNANVLWVTSGDQAVESCEKISSIDLVLMDIHIPNVDGFEATRQIKKKTPDLPIIAQTAHVFDENRQEAKRAGCDAYLVKPIESDKLYQLIDNLLFQYYSPPVRITNYS